MKHWKTWSKIHWINPYAFYVGKSWAILLISAMIIVLWPIPNPHSYLLPFPRNYNPFSIINFPLYRAQPNIQWKQDCTTEWRYIEVAQLPQLIAKYPSIWKSEYFVQVLSERWIKVLLKSGWEAKVFTIKPRSNLLSNENWQVVDKTFNKIHCLSCLKFITNTHYSVFWSLSSGNLMQKAKRKIE